MCSVMPEYQVSWQSQEDVMVCGLSESQVQESLWAMVRQMPKTRVQV